MSIRCILRRALPVAAACCMQSALPGHAQTPEEPAAAPPSEGAPAAAPEPAAATTAPAATPAAEQPAAAAPEQPAAPAPTAGPTPPATQPAPATPAVPAPPPVTPAEPAPALTPAEPPPDAAPATPEPAAEPEAPIGLKPSGSFLTRYELREGYDDLGVSRARFVEGDAAYYRAQLGLTTTPIELADDFAVVLRFAPQASGKIGTLPSTVADADVGLHEGYLRMQGGAVYADLGRFEMDYGDAAIIGNLGWHQTARSFDGGRLHVGPEGGGYIDVFLTQLAEGHGVYTDPDTGDQYYTDAAAGDQYFVGVYSDIGPWLTEGLALDVYLLSLVTAATDDFIADLDDPMPMDRDGATEMTLGVRAKQKVGIVDYRLETGLQAGERLVGLDAQTVLAYHVDAELGVSVADGALRFAAEGLYASPDDPDTIDVESWNQLYPTGHKFLGLMDVIGGRSNIASGVLHVAWKTTQSFVLKLDGHLFSRPEAAAGVEGFAGGEVDLIGVYTIGKGLALRGVGGVFVPSEDYPDDDPAYYAEVELRYTLK